MYQSYLNQSQSTLKYLDTKALNELLSDDDKLEERINEVLVPLESEKEFVLNENRTLAEKNLQLEPKLIELRSKINDLTEEGKVLCASVQEKLVEIKTKSGGMSQDTALALLQTSAAESEEQSDELVKQFLEKEVTVDAFMETFMAQRKEMHCRKVKADKMKDIILRPTQRSAGGPMYPQPGSGFYPPGPPTGNVPYPLAGPTMPMPNLFRPF